jgi:hypothetical protein
LPRSDKPSPGFFFDNSPVVLFVELHTYNTVVLRADDTQQRLVLLDATGARRVRLEYQLENFGQLRDFVLRHAAVATRLCGAASVFHRTWINKGILLGGAVLLLLIARLSLHQGQPGVSLFFIGLAGLLLVALTQDPTRVLITGDAVVIEYPGRKRTIPFNTIREIMLADVYSRGNVWAAVIIERQQGMPPL